MHWTGTKFLGDYGECFLAPSLLKRVGFEQLVDLNREVKPNFPWADFCGRKEGRWWMINVKTRLKREKSGRLNISYNTSQGLKNYQNAVKILKQYDFNTCEPMWLAIALEVNQTYEAYWGEGREMSHFMEPNIYWGIPMDEESTARYRKEKRMVADREPHDFNWLLYNDNWTYEAHRKWRIKKGLE